MKCIKFVMNHLGCFEKAHFVLLSIIMTYCFEFSLYALLFGLHYLFLFTFPFKGESFLLSFDVQHIPAETMPFPFGKSQKSPAEIVKSLKENVAYLEKLESSESKKCEKVGPFLCQHVNANISANRGL